MNRVNQLITDGLNLFFSVARLVVNATGSFVMVSTRVEQTTIVWTDSTNSSVQGYDRCISMGSALASSEH